MPKIRFDCEPVEVSQEVADRLLEGRESKTEGIVFHVEMGDGEREEISLTQTVTLIK